MASQISVRGPGGHLLAAEVDEADSARLARFRWRLLTTGYVVRRQRHQGGRRVLYMHREVVGATHGDLLRVEHVNGDKLDNRRSNLRLLPALAGPEPTAHSRDDSAATGTGRWTDLDTPRARATGAPGSSPSDLLDWLRLGGIEPMYWRRKRNTGHWHRGFRHGPILVRAQCEKSARADGGRVVFSPIDGPWPEPHCRPCERATPGSDAVREATSTDPMRRSPA